MTEVHDGTRRERATRLFTRLEQVIGPSAARTLMEHLPPMPWSELATKQDLAATEQKLHAAIDAAKFELLAAFRGELNAAITSQTRTIVLTMIATVIAVTSLVLTLSPGAGA